MQSDSFSDVFTYYFERRFGQEGSAGELARSVNRQFDLDESEGLKRQSINNWRRESLPREWWQLAAITCILCESEEEADTLLQVANHDGIHVKRAELAQQIVADEITRKRVESQVIEYWDRKSEQETPEDHSRNIAKQDTAQQDITQPVSSPQDSPEASPLASRRPNKGMIAISAILLLALLGALGYFLRSQQATKQVPTQALIHMFKDDFSDIDLCRSQWDLATSQYATCDPEAGVLRFDMPAGSEAGWMDDVVDSTLTGDFIFSRIKFTAAINRGPNLGGLGALGIQTDCNGDGTWMIVQIDGDEQVLNVEYGEDDVEEPNGTIQLGEISVGTEHEIELNWLPYSVQVSLDGETYEQAIPCASTKWLQFIASGEPETHIQGYIADVEAWAK